LVAEGKDDKISGFVFYLTKDPSHRTSGVYLVKNLKQAGVETKRNNNYYTPSAISMSCILHTGDATFCKKEQIAVVTESQKKLYILTLLFPLVSSCFLISPTCP
jgi:hypothetical protein